MLSHTEENYLKAIYKIYEKTKEIVSTNAIAESLNTTAASVTDMIKKLAKKDLIIHERYKGSRLTAQGSRIATALIRRHRLWETWLVDKLDFSWEEVHDLAEELEHIQSDKLIDSLDEYLGYPKYDPHGDPIPNAEGKYTIREQTQLSRLNVGESGHLIGVKDHDNEFLSYLNNINIGLGVRIAVIEKVGYDRSLKIAVGDGQIETHITDKVAKNLLVKKENK